MSQAWLAVDMATAIPPTGANYDGASTYKATGGFAVTVGVTFGTDGTVVNTGTGTTISRSWFIPTTVGIGSSYWVRATTTSGTPPSSGTTGSWLQLNASRSWSNSAPGGGIKESGLLLEIASDSGGVNIVYTGTITITADGQL